MLMETAISILDHLQFDCPTTEQKNVLWAMSEFVKETNTDDFLILCGSAGTGKTSITTALIGHLNANHIGYNIAAPTGRAARIIGRKAQTLSNTIHSMIYIPETNPKTDEMVWKLKSNDDEEYCVYIIDEASMIASIVNNEVGNLFFTVHSLLEGLINYVKLSNSRNKIIFLGDTNQLAPINEQDSKALDANYLSEKFQLKGKSYKLTQVKRQEDGSCILKNATITRDAIDANITSVPLEGFSKVSKNYAATTFAKEYEQNGFENIISIGATHPMNKLFNTMVRERLYGYSSKIIENNELLYISTSWKRNGEQLYNGDHVVVEEVNMNCVELVSGLHFVPIKLKYNTEENEEKIIEDYLILESVTNIDGLTKEQENRLRYERRNKNNKYRDSGFPSDDRYVGAIRACYGYSITCNKAQGGEWDKVYLNNFHIPTMKFQYTAITRAKSDVILY